MYPPTEILKYLENLDKLLRKDAFASYDKFKEANEEIFVEAIKNEISVVRSPLEEMVHTISMLSITVSTLEARVTQQDTVISDLITELSDSKLASYNSIRGISGRHYNV